MISPQEKIQLMREAQSNPGMAILHMMDILKKDLTESLVGTLGESTVLAHIEKLKGDIGPQGLTGKDGKDGKTIIGPRGLSGKDGKDGKDSKVPGLRGETGASGKDGVGIAGPKGTDGTNGKDGSPDKPEEIAAKLNTLEESVDMSVIKGMGSFIRNVQNAVREGTGKTKKIGGGGMSLLAGTNVAIVRNSGGRYTVSSTGGSGGGGFSIEDPTSGVIDGSNTVFVFAHTPSYLSAGGLHKFQTTNYTLSGNTVTFNDGDQPDTGSSLKSFYVSSSAASPSVTSGAGVPASTPTALGSIYLDTTNFVQYVAFGTSSSADWKSLATF